MLALQTIVGRNIASADQAVISVGHFAAGSANALNVMPAEAVVGGTARSYTAEVRDTLERRVRELATSLATAQGCTAEVTYRRLGTALVNHDEQVEVAIAAAASLVGADQVDGNVRPSTGGEDFATMLLQRPGAFMRIGNARGADGSFAALHTPRFDFNDEIIPLGAAYWVGLVRQELSLDGT